MTKEATAVTTTDDIGTGLALFGAKTDVVPVYAQTAEDSNAGNEYVSSEDQATPVLTILQPISEEVENVEGAKAGDLYDSLTGDLHKSVFAINLGYIRDFAIFRKRNRGGGFHGKFATKEAAEVALAELPGAVADYDIIETGNHTLLLLDKDGKPTHPVLFRFKSTGLAVSRKWNSELMSANQGAARFATVWSLTTERKNNDNGYWFALKVAHAGWAPEDLYAEAKKLHASFVPQ
jgi:hypothetical protein